MVNEQYYLAVHNVLVSKLKLYLPYSLRQDLNWVTQSFIHDQRQRLPFTALVLLGLSLL